MEKIAIIGRGRVAFHLSRALEGAGHRVTMCGGRERQCAIPRDCQVVIIAVKDDAIASVCREVADECRGSNPLVVHTAGSVEMDVLVAQRRGVLYPMQTFSMDRKVDWLEVSLFVEAGNGDDAGILRELAMSISPRVFELDSVARRDLHLAAVFCCNFSNHMYALGERILKKNGIPFDVMLPLIDETARKVHELSPVDAQTGPAVRWDESVMDSHIGMLGDERTRAIYRLLSESIHEMLPGADMNDKTVSGV